MQWIEFADKFYGYTGGKVVHLPNWCAVLERWADNLKNTDPPPDSCEITKQYVARLYFLGCIPAVFTESGNVGTSGQKFLPSFECEKVKPIGGNHRQVLCRIAVDYR
jgi:hypothetical protein